MSCQHRENLNQRNNNTTNISIVVDPPSSDEADGLPGRGHDSDPPIENENPNEGQCIDAKKDNVSGVGGNERKSQFENAKKRAQLNHRKRRKSAHKNMDSSYVPPYKKNRFRHLPSVLPSKFLLGGNIRDPLNLASLSDARINAELNKATPHSSPLPVQGEIPVFIPKNPQDPLGLTTRTPENPEDIVAGVRKNSCSKKHRHRKRTGRKRTDSECSIGTTTTTTEQPPPAAASTSAATITGQQSTEGDAKVESSETTTSKKVATTDDEAIVDSQQQHQEEDEDSSQQQQPEKKSSSTYYAPSPFAFDSTEYFLEAPPYESPFSHFAYTPTHHLQPFSPPPLPEIPHFQRRMQMFSARPQQLSLQREVFNRPFRPFPNNKKRAIVSPVVPQPGSSRRRHHHHHFFHNNNKKGDKANTSGGESSKSTSKQQQQQQQLVVNTSAGSSSFNESSVTVEGGDGGTTNKYRAKDKVFQFGNYSNYYGYRTAEQGDPRLWALKKEYFKGKEVLDIGCNSGHVTLSIARDFEPQRIHGIDIDYSLITLARKNIKHYMIRDPDNKDIVFPRSLPLIFGAMQPPPAPGEKTEKNVFPYNVSFAHENYVLNSDSQLDSVKPQYDVIVCFSVTKWIHLNFGDDGLKRFFRRIYRHLHNGGILILEPQPWHSYTKKKKITEKIHEMFNSIKFYPDQFEEFLLTEVGFASSESLGTPVHHSKGFQRPLMMFFKSESEIMDHHQTYQSPASPDMTTGIPNSCSCTSDQGPSRSVVGTE